MEPKREPSKIRSMPRIRLLAPCLILLALLLTPSQAMQRKNPSHNTQGGSLRGFEVTATSNYAGTLNCKVCPQGVRVTSSKLGMTWILKSPDWSAQVYNTTNKKYLAVPYAEWKRKIGFGPMARQKTVLKLARTKTVEPMFGLKAQQYVVTATVKVPAKDGKVVSSTHKQAEMWVAKDPSVPRQFTELMTRIFAFPSDEDGLPLKISCRQRNGKLVLIWDTLRLKRATLAASDFTPLKGYKKVKDELGLMLDEDDLFAEDDFSTGSKQERATDKEAGLFP